jgi:REP element-mobilizing transposase RayT
LSSPRIFSIQKQAMLIQPYQLDELRFASCFRVYYRWQTHRVRAMPALAKLNQEMLAALLQEYGIHILEASARETDVRALASLLPPESVATCVSKMKGRVSKWLREQSGRSSNEKLLSRGYFACTTGKSTEDTVLAYLDQQGEHHGYASRPIPPLFVATYPLAEFDEERPCAAHAVTILQFHIVLSTWKRFGIFGREEAGAVVSCWKDVEKQHPMLIEKVSFVPDHVHLAVRLHPSLSPASVVLALMNAGQELMWRGFSDSVIRARVERLWQPSAYIGSYGNLESAKISAYVRKWESMGDGGS